MLSKVSQYKWTQSVADEIEDELAMAPNRYYANALSQALEEVKGSFPNLYTEEDPEEMEK